MCTLFVKLKKLALINDNLLLFLRFRLFRYLFKWAIDSISLLTSNTIEYLNNWNNLLDM